MPKARNPAKGANNSAAGRANGDRKGRRRRGVEAPALDVTPIVELCFSRSDPGGACRVHIEGGLGSVEDGGNMTCTRTQHTVTAGVFLESFNRELATGRILRDSVVAIMYVR